MQNKVAILSVFILIFLIGGISYTYNSLVYTNNDSNVYQADPDEELPGEDDENLGDGFNESSHLTQQKNIIITVSDDEEESQPREIDDFFGSSFGTSYEGVITRIVDGTKVYNSTDVKISKTLFENDTTFEPKTYDYARLFRLLGDKMQNPGTLSESAVISLITTDGKKEDINFKKIIQIDYPRTWLDIFNILVPNNEAVLMAEEADKPVQLLIALRNFREEYNQELTSEVDVELLEGEEEDEEDDITIMSPLMQDTIKEQILRILIRLRELLPNNYQIYLELGDYYHAESMFNEELAVYMLSINRGVLDEKGEIASRLGRFYMEVLDLPNQALESFKKIMFWYCTRTNQHFASNEIPPTKSPFADTPEYKEAEETGDLTDAPVIFKPPSSSALTSAILKIRALISVKEYTKAKNLIYILKDLFNRMADDFDLQTLIPLDRSLESFVHECALLLGDTWFKEGELYFAEKEYLKIPSESTFYVTSQINLCQIYYYQKRYNDINTILNNLRKDDPLFRQAMRINKLPNPISDPDNFDPYESMPDTISYNRDYSQALCLIAMDLLSLDMRNNRAKDLLNLPVPKRQNVVQIAIQAMHYDPMNFEPYLILAEYASRSGEVDDRNQTEKWINRALKLSPNNPVVLFKLAFYYATSKDIKVKSFDRAQEILRNIIELAPDFTDAYVLLGEMHFKLAKWKESKNPVEATEHYKNAKNYFNNAIMLSPKRLDVRMKLGYCYMTQIEGIKNNIQRLWSQHQEQIENKQIKDNLLTELGALQQLLEQALTLFDIEKLTKPVILDILTETDSGIPQFILSKGIDAGVNPTLRFKVRSTSGFELELKPVKINSIYTTAEVEKYKTDPDIPFAVLDLQRSVEELGETIYINEIIHQKTSKRKNDAPEFRLYQDYVVESWASTGYIYFNFDFIEGYREQLLGRSYTKGENFEKAEDFLSLVIKYCDTYMSGKSDITAYKFALKALDEIKRAKTLSVWSDDFRREIAGQKTNSLGNQWLLNVEKDSHLYFQSLKDKPGLTIYTLPDDFCSGDVTTITRVEEELSFIAVEMSCNIRKTSLMPNIGELQYGFIIEVSDKETEKIIASLTVRLRPLDNKIVVVSKDDKDADKIELALPERPTASSILKLRLERRFEDKQAQFFLVIDDRVEIEIKNVPNYLKSQMQASGNNTMKVGLSLMGTNKKPLTFEINRVNIIRQLPN